MPPTDFDQTQTFPATQLGPPDSGTTAARATPRAQRTAQQQQLLKQRRQLEERTIAGKGTVHGGILQLLLDEEKAAQTGAREATAGMAYNQAKDATLQASGFGPDGRPMAPGAPQPGQRAASPASSRQPPRSFNPPLPRSRDSSRPNGPPVRDSPCGRCRMARSRRPRRSISPPDKRSSGNLRRGISRSRSTAQARSRLPPQELPPASRSHSSPAPHQHPAPHQLREVPRVRGQPVPKLLTRPATAPMHLSRRLSLAWRFAQALPLARPRSCRRRTGLHSLRARREPRRR